MPGHTSALETAAPLRLQCRGANPVHHQINRHPARSSPLQGFCHQGAAVPGVEDIGFYAHFLHTAVDRFDQGGEKVLSALQQL